VKKLACRVGRHDWTTRVEGGESYKVCAACGKSPRDPDPPGSQMHDEPRWDNPVAPGGGAPGGDGGGGGNGGGLSHSADYDRDNELR
jgi:hypothetical protein